MGNGKFVSECWKVFTFVVVVVVVVELMLTQC